MAAEAFALPEPPPRTLDDLAAEVLRLAVAGEIYAAVQETRLAIASHGPVVGSTVALYAVDMALQIHALKCQHANRFECAWAGQDDSSPRARWAVALAEARRDGDVRRVESLIGKGALVDVLSWAATIIRHAHSGPQAGLIRELSRGLEEWTRRDFVSPPARVQKERPPISKPSERDDKPEEGWLGLGLWKESA